jgi:hypothetical protein
VSVLRFRWQIPFASFYVYKGWRLASACMTGGH